MDLGTIFWTWLYGICVGEDEFGNRYYEHKKVSSSGRKKRWVIYKGYPEASKVPAEWHGWLHYTTSQVPKVHKKYFWEKPHVMNLTGTSRAYYPLQLNKNNQFHEAIKKRAYEPWTPN